MIVRQYNPRLDAVPIHEVWRKYHDTDFSIPAVENVLTTPIVYEDNKLIAFGMVKLFAEAILVMNLDATTRERVNAMKILFAEAFKACDKANIEQLHVSVTNPDFAEMLKKHYDFRTCEGEILVVEV